MENEMKHLVQVTQSLELNSDQLSRAVHSAVLSTLGDYRFVDGKLLKIEDVSRSRSEWREVPLDSINAYKLIQIKAAMNVRANIDVVLGLDSPKGM
ncbi:hypothetical protein Acj9p215 [Acinetobacter phage Acj9]|uniref:Uncharacterized protein n=1 Tax=Acinetobacter phage Acj9 TaxID=760939 RepID=E5EPZ9_9CAUD|nr:hypothetical protein Acj9p215 [Acinetobacter phage Acj9]ADG60115.1 hypothetical protein Acj9p215 [Acinetobacter phage Acj9]